MTWFMLQLSSTSDLVKATHQAPGQQAIDALRMAILADEEARALSKLELMAVPGMTAVILHCRVFSVLRSLTP